MDLKQFGEQLRILRQVAGWSQEALIEALDQLARSGAVSEYRVIDGTAYSYRRTDSDMPRSAFPQLEALIRHLHPLTATAFDPSASGPTAAAPPADGASAQIRRD